MHKLIYLLVLIFFAHALQADVQDANNALIRGDYAAALAEFSRLAKQGDPVAQANLGYMYYVGEGVAKDYQEAVKWYRLAAEQGNRDAQYNYAVAYAFGEGVAKDYQEAVKWYRLAAEQGHTLAQYSLAISYTYGEGVQQDLAQAKRWFRLAAQNGYRPAEKALSDIEGAIANNKQQNTKTSVAKAADSTPAKTKPLTKQKTSQVDINKTMKLAESGDPVAQVELAAYYYGKGVKQDLYQAFEWYLKSAQQGNMHAQFKLGSIYSKGDIVSQNNEDAIKWYRMAADQGQPQAQKELKIALERKRQAEAAELELKQQAKAAEREPELIVQEEFVEFVDPKLSKIQQAAKRGDVEAQYQLGNLYYQGDLVEQDYYQAAQWYEQAASKGNSKAQYSLGNMFLMGEGVNSDEAQAAKWYQAAADQGHQQAIQNLANIQVTVAPADVPEPAVASTSTDDARIAYEKGLQYSFGEDGVERDLQQAFSHFMIAADAGYSEAQYKVGVAYAYGEGVEQDINNAANWYQKAAYQGHIIAQRSLAFMYFEGQGVSQDKARALAWYRITAERGDSVDKKRLGTLKNELSAVDLRSTDGIYDELKGVINNHP